MIRYYGLYSNAHRDKMRKTQEEPFVPSKGWAEMIRKVYEVDHEVIDKIVAHLKLTFMAERPSPSSKCPTETPDGSRREREVQAVDLVVLGDILISGCQ